MATVVLLPDSDVTITGISYIKIGASTVFGAVNTDGDSSYFQFGHDGNYVVGIGAMQPSSAIASVVATLKHRLLAPWTAQKLRLFVSINGTKYYGAYQDAVYSATVAYTAISETWANSPATGVAWTTAELDDTQVGVEYSDGDNESLVITYHYVTVTYTAAAAPTPVEPVAARPKNQRWVGTYSQASEVEPDPGGVFFFKSDGFIAEVDVPTGVSGTAFKTSFARWIRGTQRRLYMNGGHTHNIVLLEDDRVVINGIPSFQETLVVSGSPAAGQVGVQAAGTGLTGEAVVYLRWKDSTGSRIGGLSNGVSITLTNQGLAFTSVATDPEDESVDQVEVWVSMDGGLPRKLQAFGLSASFSTTETVFGSAETTSFERFPTCTMNALYRDRLAMAGDPDNRQRIYLSAVGELEHYEGLFVDTKFGEPVRGIYVVRDALVVMTDTSHYVVQGFDEDDITMQVLSPSIGGLGHHSVVLVEDLAFFPSRSGWQVCNGSTISPIGVNEFNDTWASEQHWSLFQGSRFGFSIHDAESKLIKYKTPSGTQFSPMVGMPSANKAGICWVLDYSDYITRTGGIKLGIDTVAGDADTEPTASAMLMDTDGSYKLYTAHASGKIAVDNIYGLNDVDHAFEYVWQSPQIEIAHPGDDSDCAAIVKTWLHMMNEDVPIEWTIFCGNSNDWQAEMIEGKSGGRAIGGVVAGGADASGSAVRVYRDIVLMSPEVSAGATVSILLKRVASDGDTEHQAFDGSPTKSDGSLFLAPTFSIRGWGFTYKLFGSASRGLRPYEA